MCCNGKWLKATIWHKDCLWSVKMSWFWTLVICTSSRCKNRYSLLSNNFIIILVRDIICEVAYSTEVKNEILKSCSYSTNFKFHIFLLQISLKFYTMADIAISWVTTLFNFNSFTGWFTDCSCRKSFNILAELVNSYALLNLSCQAKYTLCKVELQN